MAETYRGWYLADAFADQLALYERGSFRGHFDSLSAARGFVDGELAKRGIDKALVDKIGRAL